MSNALPTSTSAPPTAAFAHVLLTRFNVRYVKDPEASSIGCDPTWLAGRFKLFEKYCLPSVLAQSEQSFEWIIFFDRETPSPFLERAQALSKLSTRIHIAFCDELPLALAQQHIKAIAGTEGTWLLTSRLDNDDAINEHYVQTLQRSLTFTRDEVLNYPEGLILSVDKYYRFRHPSNAFISLFERADKFTSIFGITRHIEADRQYPVRQLVDKPMWLQVIHGGNISNRIRGLRVTANVASVAFPNIVPKPSASSIAERTAILIENLVFYLPRKARDSGIAALRAAVGIFGIELRRRIPRGG